MCSFVFSPLRLWILDNLICMIAEEFLNLFLEGKIASCSRLLASVAQTAVACGGKREVEGSRPELELKAMESA